jgi:dipeptidyl aminopeptidase/acylaminoacyl peptidase
MARRHPLTLDDLARITSLEEIALSPDGRWVVAVLETVDEARNERPRRIVLVEVDRPARTRTIATGSSKLGSPRWSPDGRRLAFVSDRGPKGSKTQLLVRDVSPGGGAARRLTDHPRRVSAPAWSADGQWLAFVAAGADRAGDPVEAEESDPKRRVIRVRGHRHKLEGSGYLDGPLPHIWAVAADGATPERQLTDGRAEDGEPSWSLDGASIAFTSDRSAGRDRRFGGSAVQAVEVATGAVRRLTSEEAFASRPAWSPDGASIAYLRAETVHDVDGHHDRLWVVPSAGGEERCLTPDVDRGLGFRPGGYRTPSRPHWSPDGASILQIQADAGTTRLVRIASDGSGSLECLADGQRVIHEFSADASGDRIAFMASDLTTPPEIWAWQRGRAEPLRVAGFNDEWLRSVALARPRRGSVERAGQRIEFWLTPPPSGATRSGPVPLVLTVHGGPHNAFGETFYPDHQLLAAGGHAVLAVNPRGSGSYDEAFALAVVGDWGGEDFADLLTAVDAAIAESDPPIDLARLAITGGSYGGFMTCWAVTQTDRFAVGIAGAAITNLESEYGTADIGPTWLAAEQTGSPTEREALYGARSPLRFAHQVATPLLLYHGEADLRCPIEQSEQFFTALTALGRDVEFIRVPAEGHVLPGDASPVHARAVREAILDMLDRHVGSAAAGASHRDVATT